MRFRAWWVVMGLVFALLPNLVSAQTVYSVSLLDEGSRPYGFNNSGVVVGTDNNNVGFYRMSNGTVVPLDSAESVGWMVNNSGVTAGTRIDENFYFRATYYPSPGNAVMVGPEGMDTHMLAINDSGQMAGVVMNSNYEPVRFTSSGLQYLDSPGGAWINAINAAGRLGGYTSTDLFSTINPALWDGTTHIGLSLLDGGINGMVTGLNDDLAVGWSENSDLTPQAVVWMNGTITNLNISGASLANGVNGMGHIVGTQYLDGSSEGLVFVYQDGMVQSGINDYLLAAGLTDYQGLSINNMGQIMGTGYDVNGQLRGFVATPGMVPVPEGTSLSIFAIGTLMLFGRVYLRGRKTSRQT